MTGSADREGEGSRRAQNVREAAARALAEAEARKADRRAPTPNAKETGGRDGPEPVRYGDWEVKGLATDF